MEKRLHNLDGLRFFAALVVLLCHVEAIKTDMGMKALTNRFFIVSAQYAVTFFFVLSGFLITYLLLLEKKKHEKQYINLGRFYRKRILRIWPVYYLVVLAAFFVLPATSLLQGIGGAGHRLNPGQLSAYLVFFPNTGERLYGAKYALEQTWSLGVEEFFYLFFPLLLYFISIRHVRNVLIGLSILFIIAGTIVIIPTRYFPFPDSFTESIFYYLVRYRLFSFLIGGLAAYFILFPPGNSFISLLQRKWLPTLLLAVLFICTVFGITFSVGSHPLYSLLFAALFYSLVVTGNRYRIFDHPVPVYLGRISYGIYMYHPIAILIIMRVLKQNYDGSLSFSILLQVLSILLTIVLAIASYETLEKFFLRRREKRIKG